MVSSVLQRKVKSKLSVTNAAAYYRMKPIRRSEDEQWLFVDWLATTRTRTKSGQGQFAWRKMVTASRLVGVRMQICGVGLHDR